MKKWFLLGLALAGPFITSTLRAASFADSVLDYQPGTGYVSNYTSPETALGSPALADSFGTSVDPFNPAWQTNHLVSIGAGGSLTVQFATPILNDPSHPAGRDFMIYGNAGFFSTDWVNPRTDETSTLFGQNAGQTRVWVSANGVQFYQLNSALAPTVDGLYPTDAQGAFGVPVDPALGAGDFANQTLAQIRSLYGGSAGGTSFDIAWAQDGQGQPVGLSRITAVRVEVLSDHAEIDAFAAVVPEPHTWGLTALGLGLFWFLKRRR